MSERKPLPTKKDLVRVGAGSEAEYFAIVDRMAGQSKISAHEQTSNIKNYTVTNHLLTCSGRARRRSSISMTEDRSRPLSDKLNSLLTLVEYRAKKLVGADAQGRYHYEGLAEVAKKSRSSFLASSDGHFTDADILADLRG